MSDFEILDFAVFGGVDRSGLFYLLLC